MVLALFSRTTLTEVFDRLMAERGTLPGEAAQMVAFAPAYLETIDPVIAFLQGRDPLLAARICRRGFLPEGPRFNELAKLRSIDRQPATIDLAMHLATLYLEDLADLIKATVAPHFELSRYAERIGAAASSFDVIAEAIEEPPSLTDRLLIEAFRIHLKTVSPDVVGLSVPFPGNLLGAFRIAEYVKKTCPDTVVVLGGGYVNTSLRRVRDPRVFDYVDFITLDDGERPLLCLLDHLSGKRDRKELCRTFARSHGRVVLHDGAKEQDFNMEEVGMSTYDGLALDRYLSILDTMNPMHRLWSEGHWNKLTVAHGCYWKQCTFCDVGLDYIRRYEATPGDLLLQRIEALIAETGRRGFHFVDEAAPPAGLKTMALLLLERGITITWWGNIRFEEAFAPDLCRLLAASGCVAVTAGLEAASDRLLVEMKKGITVDQAARVAAAFRAASIMVHAYLMYDYPGETIEETIDSLERVRQLFATDLVQSAFWHRFTATAHSPIGLEPSRHGLTITGPMFGGFAENDLMHRRDENSCPAWLGEGLRASLLNYIEGRGLGLDVRRWFDHAVKRPRVRRDWLRHALSSQKLLDDPLAERRLVWIGGRPVHEPQAGRSTVILPNRTRDVTLRLDHSSAGWFLDLIHAATPSRDKRAEQYPELKVVRHRYPFGGPPGFDRLLHTKEWSQARQIGLLLV
jgi:radical SAM superfamily enzyme YgiQ (UPF0313 family)